MIYLPSWEHENIASAFIVNFIASYGFFNITNPFKLHVFVFRSKGLFSIL